MKIHENLKKSMKINDSSQLESSDRGHRSPLTVLGTHALKSMKIMKIYKNLRESKETNENQ